jgi:prophage regulatory protein
MSAALNIARRTIRRQQIREIVPLAGSAVDDMEQRGKFPPHFYLTYRCVAWSRTRTTF